MAAALTTGCGQGLKEFPTASVTGRVLCDGKPVPDVIVNFAPQGKDTQTDVGKFGTGAADVDGNFTISTYGDGDGAVVGKHSVSVSPPHPEDFPQFNCDCETAGNKEPVMEFDVKANDVNVVEITLPLKRNKRQPSISAEDLEDITQGDEAADPAPAK